MFFQNICTKSIWIIAVILSFATLASAQPSVVDIANAEIIVLSSTDMDFRGMTNADGQGHFLLAGVPAGGVNVSIRRNNQIIGQSSLIFDGGDLTEIQIQGVLEVPSVNDMKLSPGL